MRPVQILASVGLAAALLGLGGCLGSAIGVLAAPQSVAAGAVGGLGTRLLNAGGGPVSDLDRILAAHPEAANTGELSALRNSLLDQGIPVEGTSASDTAPADEFDRHAQNPRRLRADRVALEPQVATGTRRGPAQRVESKPFANARTSRIPASVRRWYDIPITPVRLTPMGNEGRSVSRRP